MPWRDSKLTRLLQDSLGGNTKATILVTLRSEPPHLDETLATLRFAQRAKVRGRGAKPIEMSQPSAPAPARAPP